MCWHQDGVCPRDKLNVALAAERERAEELKDGYNALALLNGQVATELDKAGLGLLPTPVGVEKLRMRAEEAKREREAARQALRVQIEGWSKSQSLLATAREALRKTAHANHINGMHRLPYEACEMPRCREARAALPKEEGPSG